MSKNAWSNSDMEGCATILGVLVLLVFALAIGPLLVMWLWNWIAVGLFAAPTIGFWEAFGLKWLCNLLFGHVVTTKG